MKFTSVCSCVVIVISLTCSVYGNPNPDDHAYHRTSYGRKLIIGFYIDTNLIQLVSYFNNKPNIFEVKIEKIKFGTSEIRF